MDQLGADGHTILYNTTIVHAPGETMMYVARNLHLHFHGLLSLSDIQAQNNQLTQYNVSTSNISPTCCGKKKKHTQSTVMVCTPEIYFYKMSIGVCILDCSVSMSRLPGIFLGVRLLTQSA